MPIKNCKIGKGTKVWHYVNLYSCEIGKDCMIGSYVEIQDNVKIGNNVRIQSHSFICSLVVIKDNCFIGHGVVFINDKHPPTLNPEKWKGTTIKEGASIGSNATILPVIIGKNARVGAGAVVTKDVPDNTTVIGNPAKELSR